MGTSYGDSLENEGQALAARSAGSRIGKAPLEIAQLAFIFMAELSACLQMITSDIAHSRDLDEASAHWMQRLMALAAMIERAFGPRGSEQRDAGKVVRLAASADTLDTHATSVDDATNLESNSIFRLSQTEISPSHGAGHDTRSTVNGQSYRRLLQLRLTAREREIVELTNKGYPPRKIARRLQLSVRTVYTHLRNVRQKQRVLGSLDPL